MPLLRITLSAVMAFALDRVCKFAVGHWLHLDSEHVAHIWPPYLTLGVSWNTGIDFGLWGDHDMRWALISFALLVSLGLVIWARNKRGWLLPLGAGMLVGGALGNAVDRSVYGAVVDYLNVSCCGIHNPYFFNLADAFIFCGCILFAFGIDAKHKPAP